MVSFSICAFGAMMTGIAADDWSTGWINFWSVIFKIGSSASFTTCYIYTSEAFPTTLRATSLGLCQIFARGAGAATPVVAQIMLASSSNFDVFIVYAVVSLAAVGVAMLLPFDTRGRSADAVEAARVASEASPLIAPTLTKGQNV